MSIFYIALRSLSVSLLAVRVIPHFKYLFDFCFMLCVCALYGMCMESSGGRKRLSEILGLYSQAARCRCSVLSHCYCLQEPCIISKLSPEKSTISLHGNNLVLSTILKDVWFLISSHKMWAFNKQWDLSTTPNNTLSRSATKIFHSFKNFYHFAS